MDLEAEARKMDAVAEGRAEQARTEERQRVNAEIAWLQRQRQEVVQSSALRRVLLVRDALDLHEIGGAMRRWYLAAFMRGWTPTIDEAKV